MRSLASCQGRPSRTVQTLGHLAQMLQWPRYYSVRDTHDVLLAGSEETYALIEKVRPSRHR
jgi:hypothetical protein